MIQRIQSVFLFLASGSCFGLLGLPLAETEAAATVPNSVFADRIFNIHDHWSMLALFLAAGLFLLIGIFLFRNRLLQMRLSLFSILLVVLGIGASAFFLLQDPAAQGADVALGVGLPLLALVFGWLAYRGIQSDERLVRSADRLR